MASGDTSPTAKMDAPLLGVTFIWGHITHGQDGHATRVADMQKAQTGKGLCLRDTIRTKINGANATDLCW